MSVFFNARAGIFKESMGAIGTEEEEGYRTGPPGYIGWRNSFLGIDSGAPYTFKNMGSVIVICKVWKRAFNVVVVSIVRCE
jgi:hypothetical protein